MTQTEALKLALEALEKNKQTHYYCEDTWYSCPQHEDGCANDSVGDECNCGADKANAEIDKAITAIKEALSAERVAQPEPYKGISKHLSQSTDGRVCIDPVTGDFGIGSVAQQSDSVSNEQKRPQNCGTSYCSCIECVMEPEQEQKMTFQQAAQLINEMKAQPEQEPVAWLYFHNRAEPQLDVQLEEPDCIKSFPDDVVWKKPLYTTQPQRKPLTDEEITLIIADCASSHQHTDIHLARAIEAAHGIKGEA
jgi:hypothetical protein